MIALLWALVLIRTDKKPPFFLKQDKQRSIDHPHRFKYHPHPSATRKIQVDRRLRRKLPRGPVAAVLLAFVIATMILLYSWVSLNRQVAEKGHDSIQPHEETIAMYRAAGRVIGDFLKKNYNSQPVTVLLPPKQHMQDIDYATLQGMKEATGNENALQLYSLTNDNNDSNRGWYIPSVDVFATALRENRDQAVIIALAGTPRKISKIDFSMLKQGPDLILMNTSLHNLKGLIAKGYIDAVLIRYPGNLYGEFNPSNPDNWLFLTPDNVHTADSLFPSLFVD